MALVNELLQSVRFLKYMGWGESSVPSLNRPRFCQISEELLTIWNQRIESHWTNKVKAARETELRWRVKENVLSSIIA